MSLLKIDIVIPVYFAPELTIRCIDAVVKNTDLAKYDVKVIVVEDSGSKENTALLNFFLAKLGLTDKIVLISHEVNKGFIEACYTGIEYRSAEYKILLNSDTYVMPYWLDEMVSVAESEEQIAMVNPNTNNSPVIDVPMPAGSNINLMHSFFRAITSEETDYIDLVTATGFCLLIKSKYIKEFGFLDRIYGKGYCEETDLYFRYITQGLRAVLARKAFVYHRGEASFTDRDGRYEANSKTLMGRYKSVYEGTYPNFASKTILNKYRKEIERQPLDLAVIVISPSNKLDGGGKKVIHNICNALNEAGISATMACVHMEKIEHLEDRLYAPIHYPAIFETGIRPKVLAYSLDYNAIEVAKYADYLYKTYHYVPQIVHLTQDIEGWFEHNNMADFETCSDLALSKMLVSPFLEDALQRSLNKTSHYKTIVNSISLDFVSKREKKKDNLFVISAMMRTDQKRGALVIESALRLLSRSLNKKIKFISFGDYNIKSAIKGIEIEHLGMVKESVIVNVLHQTDVFVEASYFQGFGLTSFEALYAGCKVVSSYNQGALSVLPQTSRVSFFQIGDSEKLAELLLKEITKGKNDHQPDLEMIYDFSSREIFPRYQQYIKEVMQLPGYDLTEFYMKAYRVATMNELSATPAQMASRYNRVRYKTVDRIMNYIDRNPSVYKVFAFVYVKAKKIAKKIKS
ncbi:MAG TPA: glycosyltransferase [Cytophagaceae bacterium]|jgi:GT2 family glycosyltransferase|nr:glycosyltransferase [Cytophagaceae bacterium]